MDLAVDILIHTILTYIVHGEVCLFVLSSRRTGASLSHDLLCVVSRGLESDIYSVSYEPPTFIKWGVEVCITFRNFQDRNLKIGICD